MQINTPNVLAEVQAAFERYEKAVAHNDVAVLDELFYNRTRRHSHLGGVSPEAFERASN